MPFFELSLLIFGRAGIWYSANHARCCSGGQYISPAPIEHECTTSRTLQIATQLTPHTDLKTSDIELIITLLALVAFGQLCDALGGSLFNPAHNAAFIVIGKDSVRLNILRMLGQIAGTGTLCSIALAKKHCVAT